MSSFKNNRVVLAVFAILMAIGLMAAYIPMLFPPSAVPDATIPSEADANNYAANLPNNPAPVATTTVTSTVPAKASLPDSFSGINDEQKSLDDFGNLLNK